MEPQNQEQVVPQGDPLQNQQPPIEQPSVTDAPNTRKWLIIGGIVLVVILALGVGVLAYQNFTAKQQPQPTPEAASELPPAPPRVPGEPTTDASREPNGSAETVNWKTYDYTSFSIKLPSDWKEYGTGNPKELVNYDIENSPGRDFDPVADKGKLKVEIYTEDTTKDLKSYVAKAKADAIEIMGNNLVWTESTVTVNNQTAVKVKTSRPGFVLYTKHPSRPTAVLIAFILDFDNYPDLADQILPTFKFD